MKDARENLDYWNGQQNLFPEEEFEGLDPDETDENWEAVYRKMRVEK